MCVGSRAAGDGCPLASDRIQVVLEVALAASHWCRQEMREQGIARTHLPHDGWEADLGAPRIHGELKMLGFDISERTVSRWMRRFRGVLCRQSAGRLS